MMIFDQKIKGDREILTISPFSFKIGQQAKINPLFIIS